MSCESVAYDSATLGAWFPPTCEGDSDAVITQMQAERGRLSGMFQQAIRKSDPFLAVLEPTKREFPDGAGDHITMPILDAARPSERDVLGWQNVEHARPGYSPCAIDYKEIPYGSRRVTACLMMDGWKSPTFCKNDLVLKYMWNDQLGAVLSIMQQWTRDIWGYWARRAYQTSVTNVVLSQPMGHPEKVGAYPSCNPTTKLTFHHLEYLFPKVRYAPAAMGGSDVVSTGEQVIFIGDHELKAFEEHYMREVEGLGFRAPDVMIPEINAIARKFGKYLLIPVSHPRRFRDRTAGESWEDALIPSVINKADGMFGTETVENPEYRNASIAKYSETIWFNRDAFTWLTPPMAMQSATQVFPAHNYSGDFELIVPPKGADKCDPKSKNIYFAADFMSGGLSMYPKRGLAILSLAHHESPCDISDVHNGPEPVCDPKWAIHACNITFTAGQLQMIISGELPDPCPAGSNLYLVTEKGHTQLIASVDNTAAFAGDGIIPAGTQVLLTLPTADAAEAVCRDCDPWAFISCMTPESCLEQYPACGEVVCAGETEEVTTCIASFGTDTVPSFVNGSDVEQVAAAADAADMETDMQTWLDSNGGGTITIEYSDSPNHVWDISIEGNDGTIDGFGFKYTDAQGNDITETLSCTTA